MPMKDSFDPAEPLPRFLADPAEPPDFGDVRSGGLGASRFLKAGVLIAAVAAIGIAVLAIGDPMGLFTDVTASLIRHSAPQPGTDQPAPAVQTAANAPALMQSAADPQALPPAAKDAPVRDETVAAEPAAKDSEPSAKDPTETTDPSSEALFRRFQAWVVEQDAQAKAEPAQPVQDAPAQPAQDAPAQLQIMQDAPAEVADNARAPHRLAQKHRQAPAVHNAQADARAQSARRPPPRPQDAHAARPPAQPVQPVQDARAQDPSGQSAQSPGFLSIFGQRN